MKIHFKRYLPFFALLMTTSIVLGQSWQKVESTNSPEKRHENGMAVANGKIYLIGGRGMHPVNEFDPKTKTWKSLNQPPLEMSHFQAVSYKNEIYVLGALSGSFPHEVPIPNIYIFNPIKNEWRKGPELPKNRLRGAAGAFVYNNKIYLVCGIQDGHWDGHVAWFDEYDPATGQWKTLPDAPHTRDHLSVAVANNKLVVTGGRQSNFKTNRVINTTIKETDVYDFKTGKWTTMSPENNIPTMRAGNTAIAYGNKVLLIGGESGEQIPAHNEVEAFNLETNKWEKFPSLLQGRHGMQVVSLDGKLYVATGSKNQGGGPELDDMEVLVK